MKIHAQKVLITKKWVTCLNVLVFFILFLIIWLLFGQGDLLGLHWLVRTGAIIWSGLVTLQNINWLNEKYNLNLSDVDIGKYIDVTNNGNIIFNLNILWMLTATFFIGVILFYVLKLTNVINYDSAGLFLTSIISFFIFFFIDLIPNTNNEILRGFIVVMIWLLTWMIFFFILTPIFNKIIINQAGSFAIKNEYINEIKELDESDKKIAAMIKSDDEYIEK